MTASEIYEALKGVPTEALYDFLDYSTYSDGQPHWRIGFMPTTDKIAAALQRDAICEWISLHSSDDVWPVLMHLGGETYWSIDDEEHYPTRLHALAAACRYVAGQKGAEK